MKSRDFYSALGIEWLRGENEFVDFEEYDDGNMGLPDLLGKIDQTIISFFIDNQIVMNTNHFPLMVIHPISINEFNGIISKLRYLKLYSNCSNTESPYEEMLLDPDGYRIAICPINPFTDLGINL